MIDMGDLHRRSREDTSRKARQAHTALRVHHRSSKATMTTIACSHHGMTSTISNRPLKPSPSATALKVGTASNSSNLRLALVSCPLRLRTTAKGKDRRRKATTTVLRSRSSSAHPLLLRRETVTIATHCGRSSCRLTKIAQASYRRKSYGER